MFIGRLAFLRSVLPSLPVYFIICSLTISCGWTPILVSVVWTTKNFFSLSMVVRWKSWHYIRPPIHLIYEILKETGSTTLEVCGKTSNSLFMDIVKDHIGLWKLRMVEYYIFLWWVASVRVGLKYLLLVVCISETWLYNSAFAWHLV